MANDANVAISMAPDKVPIFIPIMPIPSPNPMFDHLLESSHQDDSNKWSNIEFGEEITQVESIEFHFTHLIWSSEFPYKKYDISTVSRDDCVESRVKTVM